METPTLSVLMPTYNHGHFLKDSLQRILDQSYRPLEIIVLDDGSVDDTSDLLEGFTERYPNIRVLRNERNMGLLYDMNLLLKRSSGKCLFFTAADDMVSPCLFEKSMAMLEEYPQAGMCIALTSVLHRDGRREELAPSPAISKEPCFLPPKKALSAICGRRGSWFNGNVVIIKRQAILEAGGFRAELGYLADSFIYQVVAARQGVCFLPEQLGTYRKSAASFSSNMERDVPTRMKIISRAEELMLTEFKDLFTSSYAREWARSDRLGLMLSLRDPLRKDLESFSIDQEPMRPTLGPAGRFLSALSKNLILCRWWATKLWISIRTLGRFFPIRATYAVLRRLSR
jgi:glycosyltransferase involved in cell wall biosynthesis